MIKFDSFPVPATSQASPCIMSLIVTYLKYTTELYKPWSPLICYTVCTQMQDKGFSWNLCGYIKFISEVLNHVMLNLITLNHTMWSQTMACIIKACEVCTLLRYATFWDYLSVPASRVKKSKRENTAWRKLPDIFFFYGTLSIICFLKDTQCIGMWLLFPFKAKNLLTW
jgi:hypothetical protein